ncbi:MAG: class II fructose-bisphosphate aldolase [Candidatus Atribacteria bacterium]|nr:class II fructose-bisphosphate aldolase [Candidatus Atribacteria bacterium]
MNTWKDTLKNTPLSQIMKTAYVKHIIIPAFNIPYLPMVEPVIQALEDTECFALLEVARPDINRFEAKSFAAVKAEFDRFKDLAVTRMHQDHVPVIDEDGKAVDWKALISEALNLNYDSVMIDGSRLPIAENIAVTREVVNMAHPRGVQVEAELGAVLGHESGPLPPYDEIFASGKGFTSPDDAERFVRETGVDWLSVAIGNIHGAISGSAKDQKKVEARLNIDHLRKLADRTGIPLVLHGGSGVRKEYVLQAIHNGITKINVGTEIRQAYEKALRETNNVRETQGILKAKVRNILNEYYEMSHSARTLGESIEKEL